MLGRNMMASGREEAFKACAVSFDSNQEGSVLLAAFFRSRPCSDSLSALPTSVKGIWLAPHGPFCRAWAISTLAILWHFIIMFLMRTTNINLLSSVCEQGASEASLETTKSHFMHVILLGVGGTNYNQYTTITPLLNLGVPTHNVHQLATKLHCHAIKSLNKITKTRHKIHLNNNSDNGGSDGGVTGRAARRRPDRMADNPPDPH